MRKATVAALARESLTHLPSPSISGVITDALAVLRYRGAAILGVSLIALSPVIVASVDAAWSVAPNMASVDEWFLREWDLPSTARLVLSLVAEAVVTVLAVLSLQRLRGARFDHYPDVDDSLGNVARTTALGLSRFVGGWLLLGLMTVLGLFVVVPGIVFLAERGLGPTIAIMEQKSPGRALRESFYRTKGYRLLVLLLVISPRVTTELLLGALMVGADNLALYPEDWQMGIVGLTSIELGLYALSILVPAVLMACVYVQLSERRQPVIADVFA